MSVAHAVLPLDESLEALRQESIRALSEIKDQPSNAYPRKVAANLKEIAEIILKSMKAKSIGLSDANKLNGCLQRLDFNKATLTPQIVCIEQIKLCEAYHKCLLALVADPKPFAFVPWVVDKLFNVTSAGKEKAEECAKLLQARLMLFKQLHSQRNTLTIIAAIAPSSLTAVCAPVTADVASKAVDSNDMKYSASTGKPPSNIFDCSTTLLRSTGQSPVATSVKQPVATDQLPNKTISPTHG